MGSRIKEDERNERTIRNLLKLPANKKCINCNSLGPQYVCTNFWTFVCTTCSGIHREFTHRVKSVSMAKFTSQEVASLQNGGNERAKSIYFKDWDTQRHSFPNNSNIERLRDFIRHVYIDRRFSGEMRSERPPRGEDSYENRTDAFRSGSRSPPFEDSYDRRRTDRPSPGGRSDDSYSKYDDRSPEHDREIRYPSDHGRSPNRPVIVNDWRREDRFSNASKADDRRTSDGNALSDGRSPDHLNDTNMPSPVVRPGSDILGDKVIPLKIGPPKPNGIMFAEAPTLVVRSASSNSFGSFEGNQVEPKNTTLGSLIDFDTEFQPPAVTASMPHVEQSNALLTAVNPTSATSNDNWASFNFSTEAKLPQVESTVSNSMDSLLMQLTAPSSVSTQSELFLAPGGVSKPDVLVGPAHVPPFSAEEFSSAPNSTSIAFDSKGLPGSWPGVQYEQQPNPITSGGQISQSIQPPSNYPAVHLISKTSHDVTSGFETQINKAETNSSHRSALPEGFFASTHHTYPSAAHGWPTSHPTGMGFAMHYSVPVPSHNYQQPSKSSNPFDFGNESSLSYLSMAPLHSALPTMPNPSPSLMHTPNANAPSSVYMQPPVSSYTSQIPTSYADGMVSETHLGQRGVGVGNSSFYSSERANQVMGGGFPSPAAPILFPGGNPFG